MQAAQGMAPQLDSLELYFAPSLVDADVAGLFSAWVSDPHAPRQANASFGECETNPGNALWENPLLDPVNVDKNPDAKVGLGLGNNLQPVADQVLRQAALQGKTLFASTGDTGSSCPAVILPVIQAGNGVLNQVVPLLNYPAASPYAVAVGGTVLYTDGGTPAKRLLEYGWPFGGGGSSLFVEAPSYQQGVGHINGRCVTDPAGMLTNTGRLCRGIPDVAAQSGDLINGYEVVMDGSPSQGGGTSLSSPLWAGMWARVQGASRAAGGNGFANFTLYRLGKNPATAARDFTDVLVGVNGLNHAGPGWDYLTGWGTPDVTAMIADVDGRTGP
jgi:subtilase family serine protease